MYSIHLWNICRRKSTDNGLSDSVSLLSLSAHFRGKWLSDTSVYESVPAQNFRVSNETSDKFLCLKSKGASCYEIHVAK